MTLPFANVAERLRERSSSIARICPIQRHRLTRVPGSSSFVTGPLTLRTIVNPRFLFLIGGAPFSSPNGSTTRSTPGGYGCKTNRALHKRVAYEGQQVGSHIPQKVRTAGSHWQGASGLLRSRQKGVQDHKALRIEVFKARDS